MQASYPLGLLIMVGRDHRVLVFEVAGAPVRQQQLPAVCTWLLSSWSSWFKTQPQLMYTTLTLPHTHTNIAAFLTVKFMRRIIDPPLPHVCFLEMHAAL